MKNGWEHRKLGEVCHRITDGTHTTPTYTKEGVPFLSVKNLTRGFIDFSDTRFISNDEHLLLTKRCKPVRDDILYTKVGTTGIAKVVDVDEEFSIFVSVALLKVKHEIIFNRFLEHFLNSPYAKEQARKRTRGMANKNLVITDIKEIDIHFPKSLPEQQRIVGILDEAFDGIATAKANAKKNLQNARALFESQLQAVFTQHGKNWEQKPLGGLCKRITKGSSPKWQGIAYVDKPGVLFITSENVGEYRLVIDKPKYVEEKFNTKDKKSILRNGDVLTNIVGASIGRTAVFDLDEIANINQAVCLIRCEPSLLDNYYLTYLLNSPVFKNVLHDNEVNTARANLSLTFFSQLEVPLPPVNKQREIVTRLDRFGEKTQRLESIYQRKLATLDELKKSLLHQAFSGEL